MPGINRRIGTGKVQQGTNRNYLYLTATGTGAGVATLKMTVSAEIVLTGLDGVKFYDDVGGTTNEGLTRTVTAGAERTFYIKGAGRIHISDILKWTKWGLSSSGWVSATNAPSVSCDISKFKNINYLYVTGQNSIYGSVSNLTQLTYFTLTGSNTVSGSISAITELTYVSVTGSNTLSGSIQNLTKLSWWNVTGNHTCTFERVNLIKNLCSLVVTNTILSESNVNQLLADQWANKDEAKSRTDRLFDVRGNNASAAPTGQGLTDKAALEAYRSPNGDVSKNLWTVQTRSNYSAWFYGTSITAGFYASPIATNRFTTVYSLLDTLIESNYGIGGRELMADLTNPDGSSMIEMLSTIPNKPNHAKYLFLEFGANDIATFPGETTRFYDNYIILIDNALAKGWQVQDIKLLTCFRSDFVTWVDFNNQITAVGIAKSVQVIDTGNDLYNGGNYAAFMTDVVHPNNTGHARIAAYIDANIV